MAPTLYHFDASPTSRIAVLTARAVGVDLNIKVVDLFKLEHLKPEYSKINPQKTLPTLQDGDFTMWESRAIAGYLVGKYAKDDSLYPKDVQKRAVVDHRLYFDATTLFPRLLDITKPIIFRGAKILREELKTAVQEGLAILDIFLADSPWVAGDTLTIADIACVATVSSYVEMGLDVSAHANVRRWLSKCEAEIPGYNELNKPGAVELGIVLRSKLASN